MMIDAKVTITLLKTIPEKKLWLLSQESIASESQRSLVRIPFKKLENIFRSFFEEFFSVFFSVFNGYGSIDILHLSSSQNNLVLVSCWKPFHQGDFVKLSKLFMPIFTKRTQHTCTLVWSLRSVTDDFHCLTSYGASICTTTTRPRKE